jgi:ERCC4-type nuclease
MNIRYQYTDAEKQQILKSMTILCDTREKKDEHITKWFAEKNICTRKQKLDFGDYSFMVPANTLMGTVKDTYFDKSIIVERKAHLEELSGNLAQNRDRFENEWLRARDCRKILLVEKGSLADIWDGKYNTQFKSASYIGSLLSFQERFGIEAIFMPPNHSAQLIYGIFYYHLKEMLDNGL